ncbi:MAG: alpha/beta fold hydrolase, partial [Janthinobacterium lividum]
MFGTESSVTTSRRNLLAGGGTAIAAVGLAAMSGAAEARPGTGTAGRGAAAAGAGKMTSSSIVTKDGTLLYYKDWGSGPAVVFSHGYPLSSDAWEYQMMFLMQHGYRVIAHDRRGFGRSSQPGQGYDYDTFADDLATLVDALDLKDATFIGHSMGGGEVARYIGRHGEKRVAKVAFVAAVTPFILKTATNPGGAPIEVFDGMRASVQADRSQWNRDVSLPYYSYNRPGAKVSQGVRDDYWRQGMMTGVLAQYEAIGAFAETDFREDLKKINVPALVVHGSDDQIVPIEISGNLT